MADGREGRPARRVPHERSWSRRPGRRRRCTWRPREERRGRRTARRRSRRTCRRARQRSRTSTWRGRAWGLLPRRRAHSWRKPWPRGRQHGDSPCTPCATRRSFCRTAGLGAVALLAAPAREACLRGRKRGQRGGAAAGPARRPATGGGEQLLRGGLVRLLFVKFVVTRHAGVADQVEQDGAGGLGVEVHVGMDERVDEGFLRDALLVRPAAREVWACTGWRTTLA